MQGWCGDQYYKCRVPVDSVDWNLAQAKVREIEAAAILPQPLPEPERVTIADAIARYISACKARNLSDATISKYRVLLEKQLTPFGEKKSIRHTMSSRSSSSASFVMTGMRFTPIGGESEAIEEKP